MNKQKKGTYMEQTQTLIDNLYAELGQHYHKSITALEDLVKKCDKPYIPTINEECDTIYTYYYDGNGTLIEAKVHALAIIGNQLCIHYDYREPMADYTAEELQESWENRENDENWSSLQYSEVLGWFTAINLLECINEYVD